MKLTWQWNRKKKFFLFVFTVFCGCEFNYFYSFVFAETAFSTPLESITLERAIEKARENNSELKYLALEVNSSSWKKLEALSEHLPHFSMSGNQYLGLQYLRQGVNFQGQTIRLPAAYPTRLLQFDASLTLFDGLETINRFRAALYSHEAAELDFRHANFLLERQVRIQFFKSIAAKELDYVADQNIETLKQHLELAQTGEKVGTGTLEDVLRIESQLEEVLAEKILTQDNVILSKLTLSEIIGTDEQYHVLEGSLPELDEKKVTPDLKMMMTQRDDFQSQVKKEAAYDRLNDSAAGFWFPKVSVMLNRTFYEFGNFDPAIVPSTSFQNAYSLGIRLSWNLFDGGASIAKKALANNLLKHSVETTRKMTITAPNEFENWKRRYVYNIALYKARQRSVKKSQESVRLATISVKAGSKTHSDVLDAELDLFRARAGVIQAQIGAIESLNQLELALGHSL